MAISKEGFYKIKGKEYLSKNEEATIRYQRIMKWLNLKPGLHIYEIGCMFGQFRDLLSTYDENLNYKGIEINQETLNAIKNHPEDFYCHNVNQGLLFKDNTADYIICLETLEHLENPTFFLSEVKRVLKPGGKLILSLPNPFYWGEIIGQIRHLPDTEGHVASFTFVNIDALLRFAGMKLLDIQGTYTRIPFTSRLFGHYFLLKTNNLFLTRSFMYLIETAYQ